MDVAPLRLQGQSKRPASLLRWHKEQAGVESEAAARYSSAGSQPSPARRPLREFADRQPFGDSLGSPYVPPRSHTPANRRGTAGEAQGRLKMPTPVGLFRHHRESAGMTPAPIIEKLIAEGTGPARHHWSPLGNQPALRNRTPGRDYGKVATASMGEGSRTRLSLQPNASIVPAICPAQPDGRTVPSRNIGEKPELRIRLAICRILVKRSIPVLTSRVKKRTHARRRSMMPRGVSAMHEEPSRLGAE